MESQKIISMGKRGYFLEETHCIKAGLKGLLDLAAPLGVEHSANVHAQTTVCRTSLPALLWRKPLCV